MSENPEANRQGDEWTCEVCGRQSNSAITVQCEHGGQSIVKTRGLNAGKRAEGDPPAIRAEECEHKQGIYRNAMLVCDACGERVGDHYVYGLDGLKWNVDRIAIGHPVARQS